MFDSLVSWLESIGPVNAALVATLFTWLMTMAGASLPWSSSRLCTGVYLMECLGLLEE